MRYPIWKLLPLLGIPSFGGLVLLQVQKDLSSAGTIAQAAEVAPEPKVAAAPQATTERRSPQPTDGHMAAVPDEAVGNPFAGAPSAGLDFRLEMPAEQAEPADIDGKLIRTAAVDQSTPAPTTGRTASDIIAADDPFSSLPESEVTGAPKESLPVIQPAGFEKEEEAPAGVSDFGPDPFADLEPVAPNPHAAGLEERPEPAPQPSPGDMLESDDPFADPQNLSPAAPEAVEGETVPIGGPPATSEPATEDDPFGLGETEPAPLAPADEETLDPAFGESTSPPVTPASGDGTADEPLFEDDPFLSPPSDAAPLETEEEEASGAPLGVDDGPRPLPGDQDEDFRGIGTVSPDDPQGPQRAEVTVEKKAPPTAKLNEPLIYEILVTNVGDSPAHEVTISDVIPKGARLDGTIPQAELAGQSLVWKLHTLDPGKSSKIRIMVTPIEAGEIGSVATVNFVSEVAAKTNVIAPRLSLKITAPPQVAIGQPVDFRFEISNAGTAPAEKVLLRDALPDGFKHPDGNDLEYEVGTLAPGKSQSVTLRAAAVKPGNFTNTAVVTAAGGLKIEAVAAVEVASQAVSVSRKGPKRRYVGRPATYANVVRNGSDRAVRGIKVVERIPSGMEFVNASHNGQFDPDQRTIAWQIASLGPGKEQTLQVVLTAAAEGVQDSVVRVEETDGGQVELTSSTTVQGAPSLARVMQGPDGPIALGERAAFRIRVKNRGSADAAGVIVSLSLPSQLKLIDAKGGTASSNNPTGAAEVRLTSLAAGGEHELVFVIEGAAPGSARVRAEVTAAHMTQPLVCDEEVAVTAPAP